MTLFARARVLGRSVWILAFLGLLGGCSDPAAEKPSAAIGLLVPLTGGAASYGENARRGAELALSAFREQYPEVPVELRVQDSRGEAAAGTRAAAKLLDLDRVVAIVGCVTSGVTMAIAPMMNDRQVPVVSPGASSPNITDAGPFIFRTWPSDLYEAAAMAEYIAHSGVKRLAVLKINNEYGLAMERALVAKLQAMANGVEVVAVENFEQGAREVRTQLQRIKQKQADAIYFVGFPEAAVVFGRGFGEAGLDVPVFATSAFEDPQVPANTAGALDGTVYTRPISNSPAAAAFRTAYEAAFAISPGVVSDTSYDATRLILDAVRTEVEAGRRPTGQAIQAYLLAVRNHAGASGMLSFDENGDVSKPIGFFVLRDGEYKAHER